jgi:uncharacterized protein YdcH (DUF465 family)
MSSHTPHELHEEFPELGDKIRAMKSSHAHFAKLADDYHVLNRTIHRAETLIEPMDDVAVEHLRKQRLSLKDQIFTMLSA